MKMHTTPKYEERPVVSWRIGENYFLYSYKISCFKMNNRFRITIIK